MKIPLWTLGVALAALAACAREAPADAAHPLAAEPHVLDLGSVPFGERREGVWSLHNRSERALELVRIGPLGCQCADAELVLASGRRVDVREGLPISVALAPGERAELHFALDTARYRDPISRKIGTVPLLFTDAEPLLLEWSVDVWTPFVAEPWDLDLGEVGVRERAQGRVLVQAHDDEDFGLVVDAVIEDWTVRSTRLSPPGERALYEIRVMAPAELPEGGFQRHFRLPTDLAGAPPVRFSVRGVAGPDLVALPRRVLLDPSRGRNEERVTVIQRAVDGVVAQLAVDGLPDGMTLEAVDAAPAARRGFTLRWTGAAPPTTLRGALIVRTGDAERPELALPWTVLQAAGEPP
jgi:hypothetical protein